MWGAVCGCECVLCVWCVVVSVGWASERDRTRGLWGWGSGAQSLGAGPLPGGLGGPSAQAGLWTFFLALDPSAMFAGRRLLVQQVLGMEEETPALPLGRIGTSPRRQGNRFRRIYGRPGMVFQEIGPGRTASRGGCASDPF